LEWASCDFIGPAGPICHILRFYNAWWWAISVLAIPLTAGLFLSRAGKVRN
jgi:hypothetical protein